MALAVIQHLRSGSHPVPWTWGCPRLSRALTDGELPKQGIANTAMDNTGSFWQHTTPGIPGN